MNALAVALLVIAAEPSRTELVEFMQKHYPPDSFCGTGDPWPPFAQRKKPPETNALLMELSGDRRLHQAALAALRTQSHDDAVVDFFRRRLDDEVDADAAALFLLHVSEADRERVLQRFGRGDLSFDRAVLENLASSPAAFGLSTESLNRLGELYAQAKENPSKAEVTALADYQRGIEKLFGKRNWPDPNVAQYRRTHEALVKAEFVAVLTRYAPTKYVPIVKASKSAAQIENIVTPEK